RLYPSDFLYADNKKGLTPHNEVSTLLTISTNIKIVESIKIELLLIIKPSCSLRICISRKSDPTSLKRLLESMRLCKKKKTR
ncbi:MAG: hypothetical protein SOW56_05670, partial [Bacteroidaceae bacterium]|nr:hypothetical protein [Bacteroidaceae bacterium]